MDQEKIKIAMVVAVSKALGYRIEENGFFDPRLIYEKVMPEIEKSKDRETRIAMIAAVSRALKFLQEKPEAEEKEVIGHVLKEADSILEGMSTKKG